MTMMTQTRRTIKPTRVSPRPMAPFASGLEPLCSTLPTIHGAGLSKAELFKVNGAMNRAKAAYGRDCPDASFEEIHRVGVAAVHDSLRAVLRARPVAQALPAPAVVVRSSEDDFAAAVAGFAQVEFAPDYRASRPVHTPACETWWSCFGGSVKDVLAGRRTLPPICGGAPEPDWDAMYRDQEALWGPAGSDDVARGFDYLGHGEA